MLTNTEIERLVSQRKSCKSMDVKGEMIFSITGEDCIKRSYSAHQVDEIETTYIKLINLINTTL